jgi:hypothetical protein
MYKFQQARSNLPLRQAIASLRRSTVEFPPLSI